MEDKEDICRINKFLIFPYNEKKKWWCNSFPSEIITPKKWQETHWIKRDILERLKEIWNPKELCHIMSCRDAWFNTVVQLDIIIK